MSKLIDLTGKTFSRLTVLQRAANRKENTAWKCRCSCGSIVVVLGLNLKSGGTKSCGCFQTDVSWKHGMTGSTEYNSWVLLKMRCSNKSHPRYVDYGGRGITVCDRWKYSFENFYADMGDKPTPKHSIDRIDNDGNYEPSNCRWATPIQQARNKRLRISNKSGISGIFKHRGKWVSQFNIDGKTISLYWGDDFFEACCARKSAEVRYWGAC